MEGTDCGGEGGWTRVAYVNMSQSGATCPQGRLTLNGSKKVFSTLGLSYSQVCGYQRDTIAVFIHLASSVYCIEYPAHVY